MKNTTTEKQFGTFIGVDLGDKKHAICVTDKDGNILREYTITNHRKSLEQLVEEFPAAHIALEVGTHSPWISRLLQSLATVSKIDMNFLLLHGRHAR